ncbi:hypothetical protein [Methylobacterium sp. sgz302541]|uniref:hypothetical protein n=1 Tax=unclassified Methylobacterium TaxID=2615210 RepID=UPI003D333BA3
MRAALGAGARCWGGLALAVLTLLALALPAQAARLLSIEGGEGGGYGRIALTFDSAVPVKARLSGAVLIITFGDTATGGAERLALSMPNYVTVVRRDPDGTGLRLALQKPYRLNVQVAGERAYVDLLPEGWAGLPPPLPPEIVAALAKRALAAEAALKASAPVPVAKPLAVEVAHLPTLTRLTVRLPQGTESTARGDGPATRVTVPGFWKVDETDARGRLRPAVTRFLVESDSAATSFLVQPAEGYVVTTDRDDEGVSIDIAREAAKGVAKSSGKPAAKDAFAKDAHADEHSKDAHAAEPAAPAGKTTSVKPASGHGEDAHAAPEPQAPAKAPPRAAPIRPAAAETVEEAPVPAPDRTGVRKAAGNVVFPFRRQPAVALFERAGIVTLAFETREPVEIPAGAAAAGIVPLGPPRRVGEVVMLRFPAPAGKLLDLLPVGPLAAPAGWELLAGESLSPSEALVANRVSAGGRFALGVRLPDPGAATWLDLDGERIAVVTTLGRRPAGVAKRQRFVDAELLPSRLGVAVLAFADDLTVRPDLDGVAIAREGGLAVSAVERPAEVVAADVDQPAIDRKAWDEARRGDVFTAMRQQFGAIAEQPLSLRGPARLALARFQLANGFNPEALTVLAAAAEDDPALGAQRDVAILRGLGNARMGRLAETKQFLAGKALARDPEAALWRGYAAAQAGLWLEADGAMRAGLAVLDRYPDDLQALLRTAVAEAAIEIGDFEMGKRQIAIIDRLSPAPLQRDMLKYLTARLDEASGQTLAALSAYERQAEGAERPVAAAATLRGAMLAHSAGKLSAKDTVERLERLMLMWHGGPVETEMTSGLFSLYRETGRWRDAFTAVRRAEAAAGDAPAARALHTEALALFDDLFLSPLGDQMTGVEAVALYFDFKDFGPVGRRGDEIVRRLADRLVALDLLDAAAGLLQHQVDHRLTGAARASVATRLAAVRIMDAQPMKALEALDSTYLPELPGELRRARMLLRARALSDLSRTDVALETLEGDNAPDAQRLRADILWGARRWREAGEAHEMLLGDAWRSGKPLDDASRADVIRAAIAYGLSSEAIGLERLKAKYADPMAESADARTFALLTAPNASRTAGFREIAQRASTAQTLAAFLDEYRKRYPENAVPERGKPQAATEAPAGTPPG